MLKKKELWGEKAYLILASLFIASLVTCNLIANKFVIVDLFFKEFKLSAGVLAYPVTFLITDILSEIYGKVKTRRVVLSGFFASLFVLFILWLGGVFPSIEGSPVNEDQYNYVFQNAWRIIFASMIAYLSAQLIDVRLFHFWKKLTKGRHLWLRNNASTIASQLIDTSLVVFVLFVGKKTNNEMASLIIDGWLFKTLCAFVDTPIFYLLTSLFRKKLNLKKGEELA